ncbi:hypothetical protein ElyMa_004111000 [Elysia marginata]|uniref:Uncharacterized protein n=1 Tax=Elysia marginata TaxID=1093978 RepID=A0AAV4GBQ8_9GAST|nr:hypothetical protein ElyMa_004111000 [Elysia marginata]
MLGCSYVLSGAALAQMVEFAPYMPMDHASTFLGPDYFATGIIGVSLALEFYGVPGADVFGPCNGTTWQVCDLISDNKVFAHVDLSPSNVTRLASIWAAFFRYYGHYR